jgi:hypothetical protein
MDEEALEFMRAFAAGRRWQSARTYAKFAPHEYTVRDWLPDAQGDFERFVTAIGAFGYDGKFGRRAFRYFNVDGYRYWTMGAPAGETTVINREPLRKASEP